MTWIKKQRMDVIRSMVHRYVVPLIFQNNEAIFREVQDEDIRWLMEEYSSGREDVDTIFDEYALEYRDRSIVGCIVTNPHFKWGFARGPPRGL